MGWLHSAPKSSRNIQFYVIFVYAFSLLSACIFAYILVNVDFFPSHLHTIITLPHPQTPPWPVFHLCGLAPSHTDTKCTARSIAFMRAVGSKMRIFLYQKYRFAVLSLFFFFLYFGIFNLLFSFTLHLFRRFAFFTLLSFVVTPNKRKVMTHASRGYS